MEISTRNDGQERTERARTKRKNPSDVKNETEQNERTARDKELDTYDVSQNELHLLTYSIFGSFQ